MGSIVIGPFAFPVGALLLIGAAFVALILGRRLGRERGAVIEAHLWKVLVAGALGARLAFVVRYWDKYKDAPLDIIDIRDGGFFAIAGLVAALAMVAWLALRDHAGRKPLLLSSAAGLLVWGGGMAASLLFYTGMPGLPDVTLMRLDGSRVQMKSFAGKPVVLNLWATWCPPCRREMPALRDAQRNNPDIVFVFANQGESAAAVRDYLDRERLSLDNMLLDMDRQTARETGSPALPTTLFFDAGGRLVDRRIGELSAATLAQRLESLRGSR